MFPCLADEMLSDRIDFVHLFLCSYFHILCFHGKYMHVFHHCPQKSYAEPFILRFVWQHLFTRTDENDKYILHFFHNLRKNERNSKHKSKVYREFINLFVIWEVYSFKVPTIHKQSKYLVIKKVYSFGIRF